MSLSGGGQAGGFRAAKEFVGGIRRMRLPETAQEGESDGEEHVEGDWVVQLTHVVCDFRANAEGSKGDDLEELHTHTASRGTRASVRDACRNFTQFLRSATRVPGCASCVLAGPEAPHTKKQQLRRSVMLASTIARIIQHLFHTEPPAAPTKGEPCGAAYHYDCVA